MRIISFILIFFLLSPLTRGQGSPVTDSLKHALSSARHDTVKAGLLNRLSTEYRKINLDSALAYARSALALTENAGTESKEASLLVESLNNIAVCNAMKGQLDEAASLFERALSVNRSRKDKKAIAKSLNNLGNVSLYSSKLEKALEYYLESLSLNESLGNLQEVANVAGNIGIVYDRIGQKSKALDYYLRSVDANDRNKASYNNSEVFSNIGLIYRDLGNDSLSLAYQFKALGLFKEAGDQFGIARVYNNIALVYEARKEFEKALSYFFKAIELREQSGETNGLCIAYHNAGNVYLQQEKYAQAIEYFDKSRKIAEEFGYNNLLKDIYRNAAAAYAGIGDHRQSYELMQLHSSVKDTIYNEASAELIAEMQTKYETEKKEQALQMKSLEVEQQKATNRMQVILSAVIIASIIILSLLFYNRYRLKQKALMEQEINRQQKIQFRAVLDAQEEERRRIAKELHDGVGNQLLALQMAWKRAEPAVAETHSHDPSLQTIGKIMKDVTEEVRSVSHRMMPKVLDEFGFVPAIRDMLEKALGYSGIKYIFETHNIKERFDPRLEVAIYRITQELINNVIKHSNATMVNVQMLKKRQHLVLLVEDNGRGMKKEQNAKGGIGFTSIKSRLNIISGEINIEPGESTGTLVTIRIPLEHEPKGA